jgi:hypothetical protein
MQTRFLIDGEPTHTLFPLSDPQQLERLLQISPLYTSLSMAALADDHWAGGWAAALRSHTRSTIISMREFVDFLEKCRRAGLADETASDSIVNLDATFTLHDQAKFRVKIV